MKSSVFSLLFSLFFVPLHAVVQESGQVNFSKGWNLSVIQTSLEDSESPNLCNCTSSLQGALIKRGGSERYIEQAYSSNPVTSLYRAYASTQNTVLKNLIATIGNSIVYSTQDVVPQWITISSRITPNQHWSFVTMNNKVIMTGDGQYDNMKQFDITFSSLSDLMAIDSSSISFQIRPKYLITSKNYLIGSNVALITSQNLQVATTDYYPSRFYYSLLNQPSSMTAVRYIEFRTNDGEDITGAGEMNNRVNIFKPSSIGELDFTVLNLPSQGGDWTFNQIVNGFGLAAPRSLVNTGQFYVMGSQDGIRLWDGGRRSRLTPSDESRLISNKIQTLIDKLIRAGTYDKIVGKYYPKEEWYIMSYEDPDKFPKGKHNSVVIYDFKLGEWFPICNWNAESIEVWNGSGDNGELTFGESNDGYVKLANLTQKIDDAPREIWVDSMDSSGPWTGTAQFLRDTLNVREGTASFKLFITGSITSSSMTRIAVLNFGEWPDKGKVFKSNAALNFKVMTSSGIHISSFSVDLRVDEISGTFDTLFTSYSISSTTFSGMDGRWIDITVNLSSFGLNPSWNDLADETAPFSDSLTFYGIRFNLWGVDGASITVDDLRIVELKDQPNNFFRYSKVFDFGTLSYKTFGQIWTTREKDASSSFKVDVYNDFGKILKTIVYDADIPKEIFVCNYSSGYNITALDSTDFARLRSTDIPQSLGDYLNGVADRTHIFSYDRQNNKLVKFDRNNLAVFSSTFGSLGTGTTNQDTVHQMAVTDKRKSIIFIDLQNNRFMEYFKKDFSFVRQYGTLGNGTTSLHQPTGIQATDDDGKIYVEDDGQRRLLVLDQSTFGIVSVVDMDYNNVGDASLALTPDSILIAYNKTSETNEESQDVILERRERANPKNLLFRIKLRPKLAQEGSIEFILRGDIAVLGRYVFVSFSDETNAQYYLQKLLVEDGTLVKEFKTAGINYSVIGDGLSYLPTIKNESKNLNNEGKYVQLKFYDEEKDNDVKLYNYNLIVEKQSLKYE